MKNSEKRPAGYALPATDLKKLIAGHPDYPLVVFAGDEANIGDYTFMTCSSVSAEIGEVLDCLQEIDDERCYTDREEFAEVLLDSMEEERNHFDGSEVEWEMYFERALSEYDPYWKPCIILYVNN